MPYHEFWEGLKVQEALAQSQSANHLTLHEWIMGQNSQQSQNQDQLVKNKGVEA